MKLARKNEPHFPIISELKIPYLHLKELFLFYRNAKNIANNYYNS